MNIASIDIGTNTVLLLIAKAVNPDNIIPLLNVYEMPRIGKNLLHTGTISEDKIELLIKIISNYKKIAEEYNCDLIIPFATQAMRIAKNNKNVIDRVLEETNLTIKIIDGLREAELSYIGSISNCPTSDNYLVIDIGGGSTEIIYGSKEKIIYANSFKIGVVTLSEKYFLEGNNNKNVKEALDFIQQTFNIPIKISPDTLIVSVAGTPTSLSCMAQNIKIYKDEFVENKKLTKQEIDLLINELKILSPKEALQVYGEVLLGREDLILSGALILSSLLDILNSSFTLVSTRGLRYGIIIDYLRNLKREN